MDLRPSPAVARAVGLEAASWKLWEVLEKVLLLDKEEQDQVAEAVEGVLQQLLLASRCEAPTAVLSGCQWLSDALLQTCGRFLTYPGSGGGIAGFVPCACLEGGHRRWPPLRRMGLIIQVHLCFTIEAWWQCELPGVCDAGHGTDAGLLVRAMRVP
jgi:hypothetical protein